MLSQEAAGRAEKEIPIGNIVFMGMVRWLSIQSDLLQAFISLLLILFILLVKYGNFSHCTRPADHMVRGAGLYGACKDLH
jgi:hypothetical protein